MVHSYRILQNWNQWLIQQHLGSALLEAEQLMLSNLLGRHLGKHAVLIGVPHQGELLKATRLPCHTLLTPFFDKESRINTVESDLHELGLLTGSVDLVLLPHTLQFMDNPRQLLAEACRIIKPEGLIVVTGFNPFSFWGLKKVLTNHKSLPWVGNFMPANKIKNWLQLADFKVENRLPFLFRPPLTKQSIYDRIHFMEHLGNRCFPLWSGAYMLIARAKVVPLTPIRMKWKQQLNNIRISTTISGHIARHTHET